MPVTVFKISWNGSEFPENLYFPILLYTHEVSKISWNQEISWKLASLHTIDQWFTQLLEWTSILFCDITVEEIIFLCIILTIFEISLQDWQKQKITHDSYLESDKLKIKPIQKGLIWSVLH